MRFDEIDFEDEVLDGLYDMNFEEMTPVQEATIPVILEGSDLIACAQTGTGKTAAYTLPLLNKLLVEGVNVATCHVKARKQNETSGIIKREIPIRADKVQLYCSTCKKGVRVGFKLDGDKKVRVCKKCGKEI